MRVNVVDDSRGGGDEDVVDLSAMHGCCLLVFDFRCVVVCVYVIVVVAVISGASREIVVVQIWELQGIVKVRSC